MEDSPDNDDHHNHGQHERDDDGDKVENFSLQRSETCIGCKSELGDAAKNGAVSRANNKANGSTGDDMGASDTDADSCHLCSLQIPNET